MTDDVKTPRKAYRQKDLQPFVGLGRSRIKQMIRDGVFPDGVKISPQSRTKIWFEDVLLNWQAQRPKT